MRADRRGKTTERTGGEREIGNGKEPRIVTG